MTEKHTHEFGEHGRALVVEDDPSWQQLLSEILTDSGMEVDVTDNLPDAIEILRGASHRIAVLDLSLGGVDHHNQDGLRVAEAVRRYDPTCTSIFLTGFATVELAVEVIQKHGAFTCLRKEVFRRSEFRKVVEQALARTPTPQAATVYDMPQPPSAGAAQESSSSGAALLVEDDAGWRSLLTELLTDAGYRAILSSSYVEALGLLKREQFALAVLDLSLASSIAENNQDGFRLLSATQRGSVPAVVVSGYADPARIEKAYTDGQIFACIEKQSFDRKSFLETVRNARDKQPVDPILRSLTDREREVLTLLAGGLTNKEIAKALTITPNTVKRHLKSLFVKLNVNTRSAASAWATMMKLV